MDPIHIVLLAALALLVIVALWRSRSAPRPALPYTWRASLLTPAEHQFYRALAPSIPPGLVVCVKVRLMDVISVPDDAWRQYGAQGSGMHCDFVLASADRLAPLLVVELDDRSHRTAQAQERDAFKDTALAAAGVPILRVRATWGYDVAELRRKIGAVLAD